MDSAIPLSFDDDSNLVYDQLMNISTERLVRVVRQICEYTLNEYGTNPPPTIKLHNSDASIQHTQTAKTIDSNATRPPGGLR